FGRPACHSGAPASHAGAHANLWFSEIALPLSDFVNVYIGRITTSGTITEYLVPTTNDYMGGITSGPDGNIWFVESTGKIGHLVLNAPDITPAPSLTVAPNNVFTGTVATFTAPQPNAPASSYTATINWGD